MSSIMCKIAIVKYRRERIMNFTAYIERQKKMIRSRHEGDTFLLQQGEVIPVSESERLYIELCNSKGLNTLERQFARRSAGVFSAV